MERILIIDDEWGMREGISRILRKAEYECDTAENGEKGLALFNEKDYSVCLVDLKLPDIDGLSLLKSFREKKPNAVCIVISAYANLETAISTTRAGAFDFLPKPFTPDQLRLVVRRGMDRNNLLLEAEELRREREASLYELASERSRMRTIMNTLRDGVIVVNSMGELALMNPTAQSILGIRAPQIGNNLVEQLPESDLKIKIEELIKDPIDEGTHRVYEVDGLTEGQVLSLYDCSIPTPHSSDEAGRTIVLRDVTHWAELDRTKSNFVRLVSHEVKAPIGAVIGFLDLLLGGYIDDENKQEDYLRRSKKRLEGLLSMVKDLLAITRMEKTKTFLTFEKMNLKEIVLEVVGSLESSAKEKGEEVIVDIEDTEDIQADETSMFQLFTNLVSNAIKYNKDNENVEITGKKVGGGIEIDVRDHGIGMTKDQIAHIWEPFYRVKSDEVKKISGTGLGLSIVRKIVDNHRGSIDVESVPGEGTVFKLFLPFEQ